MNAACVWIVSNQPTPYRAPVLDALRDLRPDLNLVEIYRYTRATDREWDHAPEDYRVFLRDREHHSGLSLSFREPFTLLRRSRGLPRPNVIVTGGYEAPLVFLLLLTLSRLWSVKLILWAGTHEYSSLNTGILARAWRLMVHRLIDGLIAYSTSATRYAKSLVPSLEVDTVGNAHRRLPTHRAGGTRRMDAIRILYVGRIVPEKRINLLVQGAELWSLSHDMPLEVVVAGSGPGEEVLASASIDVHLLGHLGPGELARELGQADVLALLSVFDPWGLVVNEAMEVGTPTIVDARAGCVPDLADETTSIIRYFDSAADVAAALEDFQKLSADEIEGIRRRAQARAGTFGPEQVAARIEVALAKHMGWRK